MRKIWEFLRSRKLALTLLPVFIIPLVVGALFFPGLSYIFSAWWFVAIGLALILNTLFCTLPRVRMVWRRTFREPPQFDRDSLSKLPNQREVGFSEPLDEVVARTRASLLKRRYRLKESVAPAGVSVFAEKGRFGAWGSLLFHLGLLVVFLGASFGALTNLRGRFVLTEGQTFTEAHGDYQQLREAPFFREGHQGFQVTLDKLYIKYDKQGSVADYFSDVTVFDEGTKVKAQRVAVNNPLSYGNFVFFQSARYGFSPLLIIEDKDGRTLLRAFVSLNRVEKAGRVQWIDTFSVPDTDLRISAQFYPDAVAPGGLRLETKSIVPKRPALQLNVTQGKKVLFRGPLFLPGSVNFDGMALTFADVRQWSEFYVTKDLGIPVVFTGFWLAVFALGVRFLFAHKRIWLVLEPRRGRVTGAVAGTSDRYHALFKQEFDKIVDELTQSQSL